MRNPKPVVVFSVMALALALRLAHLSSAMLSPLSYQPGPDEDYYQRFGVAVASGSGALDPEFRFMDPAYGYLLGWVFRIAGVNLFAVYLLQALFDTATAYGVYRIGVTLGRPRAGLCGAALYALTASAIMFSATLLKEIWVTGYLTWWIVAALTLAQGRGKLAWLAFGVYCGCGVALRSNLLLLGLGALLVPLLVPAPPDGGRRSWAAPAALLAGGLALALLPWSLRNAQSGDGLAPLPHNGGIVLHQIYNESNPDASMWVPAFVNYLHPSEIWRGYAAEAARRLGRPLSPPEVDHYWRGEALRWMAQHPGAVAADLVRKGLAFLSMAEVPNNRSSVEERLFSPVLRALPGPVPWLLSLGLAGLAWLAWSDRRWPIVAAPILLSWLMVAAFWAEDRFRFHSMGALAACAGFWIDEVSLSIRAGQWRRAAPFIAGAVLLAALSVWLGGRTPPPAVRWDHVVWGYLKMGRSGQAEELARRILAAQPDNAPLLEALGVIEATQGRNAEAQRDLQRALALRPASHVGHYNLARVFLAEDDRARALAEVRAALQLYPAPEYRQLLQRLEAGR